MTNIKIKVILGSTREGRFSEKPGQWILNQLKNTSGVSAELLDLRDYPLPFFNESISPGEIKEPYQDPLIKKWTEKIADADGYVIVAPEYNHGYPAVLKNALDYVYKEWNRKVVGFVSYGGVGGARSVEQLRQVAVQLQMVPLQSAIHISAAVYSAANKLPLEESQPAFEPINVIAGKFIQQLVWWTEALKVAREK